MRNDLEQKKQKKIYSKILFNFTISITLTIILLSTVLYFNFQTIVLHMTQSYAKDNLSQISYSGTLMNKTTYSLLMQMNVDNDIRNLMFDYTPESEQLILSKRRLFSYVNVNPFIQSIYVYNRSTDVFYDSGLNTFSSRDFYDKEIMYILDNFDKYQILTPIPRVVRNNNINSDADIKTKVYTYVFYDKELNNSNSKLEKAIVVNVNENFIKDMINTMSLNKNNEIYIIDGNGVLLQSNTSTKMLSKITDRAFIQKVIKNSASQGSFIENVDNKKSLVSFTSSSILDWKFICVTPYEIVMDKVNYMKDKVLIICSILFTLGILVSFLLSRRLYHPISFLQQDLQALKKEQLNNLKLLKQAYLKSILQSGINTDMESIYKAFAAHGINLDPLEKYQVMVITVDHYFDFCNKYSFSDRSLLQFGIMNISSEACTAHFKNESFVFGDDHIVMIMNASDSTTDLQLIKDISVQIIEAILSNLHLSISISISSLGDNMNDINLKYYEAMETSQYKIYSGCNSILMYQDIIEKHSKKFSYPIEKETKLINELMLGHVEEVQAIFNEILNTTENYSYKSFILTLTRISTAIHIAVDNFEENSSYNIGYDFPKFILELNKLEYMDDIRNHFSSLFEYIFEKVLEKKEKKYDELISKVKEIINQNYTDKNLSLESIADMTGMSASYLGKLFKKFTSNTISDYIMQTRLETSKQLLTSTNYPIEKITEKIGLTYSNYFYKIFKKTYGITPNEYKQKMSLQKNTKNIDV